MASNSLTPTNKAVQTAGVIRQLLCAIVFWGIFWYVSTAMFQPKFTGAVSFLHLTSPIILSVVSVFLWRTLLAYREASRYFARSTSHHSTMADNQYR